MTFQRPLAFTLIAGYLVFAAAAARAQDTNDRVNPVAAMLLDFNERIEGYKELGEEVAEEVPDAETVADPAKLRAREDALASRIRAMRASAAHGAIFTPDIRALFTRVRPQMR